MFLRQAPDFRAETEQQFVRGSTERSDGIPIFVKVWYINDIPAIIDLTCFEVEVVLDASRRGFFHSRNVGVAGSLTVHGAN